ncbi:MAG: dTMP kinase [Steroidobacteraceae bacterium]|jgi:dTMP kinase
MSTAGRFLTLEGIEGVGKTTQVARLSKALSDRAIAHVVTREPGGTPLAEQIRELVLTARAESLPDTAELLLMFAARSVHLHNHIEPQLAAGRWVICDRFTDATYAYQGAGRGLGADSIARLESLVQGKRRPDLTVLLDLPVTVGLTRAQARNVGADRGARAGHGARGAAGAAQGAPATDRFETQRVEFFERVRAAYLARAAAEPERMAVIDASPDADHVAAQILSALRARSWIT